MSPFMDVFHAVTLMLMPFFDAAAAAMPLMPFFRLIY